MRMWEWKAPGVPPEYIYPSLWRSSERPSWEIPSVVQGIWSLLLWGEGHPVGLGMGTPIQPVQPVQEVKYRIHRRDRRQKHIGMRI